jgi:hypothetical protein
MRLHLVAGGWLRHKDCKFPRLCGSRLTARRPEHLPLVLLIPMHLCRDIVVRAVAEDRQPNSR